MFSERKATHITSESVDDPASLHRLADCYRYPESPSPDPDSPYVRVNFVSSIDGAVTHNGKSGELGGPGDRAVFRTLRGLADVILVGARTAVTEGYRQPQPDDVFTDLRRDHGQAPAPRLVLVSRSLNIPADYAPLGDTGTVVFTCASAPDDRRQALAGAGATIMACGQDTVDLKRVLEICGTNRWNRVLCEGGPSLFGSLIAADLVDELCHTTSPVLAGGDAGRIAHGPDTALRPMRPETILTDDDGNVFTRWVRGPGR
ncbi:MAG: pyrimidine reductase family protein [Gordonia amarae]